MGLHRFNNKREQRKLWFKQNKNKITKISTITLSVIVFVVGVILLTRADFTKLIDLDMISTKAGNVCEYEVGHVFEFDYTGNVQDFKVPCNGEYKIELWGASGGDTYAGKGAYTKGNIELSSLNTYYIYVGGGTGSCFMEDHDENFNGGGLCTADKNTRTWGTGGGATDIRTVNGNWNNFDSLKSRIMVAAGGGGGFVQGSTNYSTAGAAGGLVGYNANNTSSFGNDYGYAIGGTQTNGGICDTSTNTTWCRPGTFGSGGNQLVAGAAHSGGGGGYYGGAQSGHVDAGAGGSSFISGYSGCNAISQSSTSTNIVHTNQPNHYSDNVFTNGVMIDGKGCNWSTGSATNCGANQVQPDGTSTAGHSGNGYARITLLSTTDEIITPTVELYDGMVPVTYDSNGNTLVADTSTEWYSYGGHKWANAVLVSNTSTYLDSNNNVLTNKKGTVIPESDILQYYVWIPRFKYKLFNANNGSVDEQMIEIKFQNKDNTKENGNQNGQWLTHPAFTFGDTELNGFWVAKFEPHLTTGTLSCTDENCNVSNLRIIPNVSSYRNITLGNMFYVSRSVEKYFGLNTNQVDTHMTKNMEWGAVAYLSSSRFGLYRSSNTCNNSLNNIAITLSNGNTENRCQVWINPSVYYITGASGSTMDSAYTSSCVGWNDQTYGGVTSTTGNYYGIYDMSGGGWEYVMSNIKNGSSSFTWDSGSSDLSEPNIKYYDAYTNNENQSNAYSNGKLGDATKEVLKTNGSVPSSWFNDEASFPNGTYMFFMRGNYHRGEATAGIFYFAMQNGSPYGGVTFRPVITKD